MKCGNFHNSSKMFYHIARDAYVTEFITASDIQHAQCAINAEEMGFDR